MPIDRSIWPPGRLSLKSTLPGAAFYGQGLFCALGKYLFSSAVPAERRIRLETRKIRAEEATFCGPSAGYQCSGVASDPRLVQVKTEDYSFNVPRDYSRLPDDKPSG